MTELTDRMRTCAAAIRDRIHDAPMPTEHMLDDAADLLENAADELEKPIEVRLGDPIAILPDTLTATITQPTAHWIGDDLKPIPNVPVSKNACPNCDSRASKTVRARGKTLELECPVCGVRWKR